MPRETAMSDSIKLQILVVHTSPKLGEAVESILQDAGYATDVCPTAADALTHLNSERPSAIVLDLHVNDIAAVEFIALVREITPAPILVVHDEDASSDALDALSAGADDYVCRTIQEDQEQTRRELVVRLESCLRVAGRTPDRWDGELVFGDIRVDLGQKRVFKGEQPVSLTRTEYLLLQQFMRNPERILSTEDLLTAVWGSAQAQRAHYVRVYVHRLRQRVGWDADEGARIQTFRGRGYSLTSDVAQSEAK